MFNRFPYTNFHELNLDWIIERVKYCIDTVNEAYDYLKANLKKTVTDTFLEMLANDELNVELLTSYNSETEELTLHMNLIEED